MARWIQGEADELKNMRIPYAAQLVADQIGHKAILFGSRWDADYCQREHPGISFSPVREASAKD